MQGAGWAIFVLTSPGSHILVTMKVTDRSFLRSLLHMDPVFPLQCSCPVDQHKPLLGMAFGKLEISWLVPSVWKASSVLRASFSMSWDSLLSLSVHSICEQLQFSLSHNSLPRASPASHRSGPAALSSCGPSFLAL